MQVANATYRPDGSILATIDGMLVTVPDAATNRQRQAIADWVAAGNAITAYSDPPPTADDVWAEKDRRWSLGFTYTFPDERGAHIIGTTPKDLQDWQKVGELANAAVQLGQPDTPIGIFTNTGPVTIKASEWWNIVIATAMFQQPIFQGAVALVAMDPIPADYATNDSYWTAAS